MYVIRTLAVAVGAAAIFAAGVAAEQLRPFGSKYNRKNATDLARRIAQMDAQRCCHD